MNSWIRGVRILDPLTQQDQLGDVVISNGVIQSIGSSLDLSHDGLREIDGRGCVLGPGLVDLYSQTGEPGYESRETLTQLLQAAVQGGFTRVGVLPNTMPAVDTPAQVAQRVASCQAEQPVHQAQCLPWGAITYGTRGDRLTDVMELGETNIVGLGDGRSLNNQKLVRCLLEYTQLLSLPLALWPCDVSQSGVCRDGADAIRLGLSPLSSTAETQPLSVLLEEISVSRRPVHLMRISTARSVELIRAAKTRGLPVTASVTWLHLLFSTEDLDSYTPSLRLMPPLGTPADQQALLMGLEDGTLDAIAVDHCAYTYEEKAVPFGLAPPGAIGLQLALSMLWHTFVESNRWTALQLWSYLSLNPARCLGLEPATIQPQAIADLVLFNPSDSWLVTSESVGCDVINTPYANQTVKGRVRQTWVPNPV